MNIKTWVTSALSITVLLPLAAYAADSPATQPAPLSPQLTQAIAQLSADNYQDRQDAVTKIQAALAQSIGQMVQQDDPEARNRMAGIMEYNAALSRWAIDALQMPADQRAPLARWAMTPQAAPLIAQAYASHPEQRAEGIKELAKHTDPNATILLARLISDDDSGVRLMAIDAIKDRPASTAVIDALWNVATGSLKATPSNTMFRARGIGRMAIGNGLIVGRFQQDELAAIETLVHLKDPSIPSRIQAYLEHIAKDPTRQVSVNPMYGSDPLRGVLALAAGYQAKEAVAPLMKIINGSVNNTSNFNFNGHPICITNRTAAMATICLITGQKLEDYKLAKSPELNQWTSPDSAADSDTADKLNKWYKSHQAEFAPAMPPATGPVSRAKHST